MNAMSAAPVLGDLARHLTERRDCVFYFDISPLLEESWTGIPVVAGGLARALLQTVPERVAFFFESTLLPEAAIRDALQRGTGRFLSRELGARRIARTPLPLVSEHGISIGLHPSAKRIRRAFDLECSIVHDLSTLITPQFHVLDNIDHHMQSIGDDIRSNDLTICVSAATRADLVAYLGIPEQQVIVAQNGVCWPEWYAVQAENDVDFERIEPYVLVLGTLEPRKNIVRIFEALSLFPDLLDRHRFVFVGKNGWLQEQQAIPPQIEAAIRSGRILFTGFVSDYEKYKLYRGAEATIYPSLFEGFGLPVLESLSAGVPCVASYSSSIPEVGGAHCHYFDPLSATDLYRALTEIRELWRQNRAALRDACRAHAARFTWEASLATILAGLTPLVEERYTARPKVGAERARRPGNWFPPATPEILFDN